MFKTSRPFLEATAVRCSRRDLRRGSPEPRPATATISDVGEVSTQSGAEEPNLGTGATPTADTVDANFDPSPSAYGSDEPDNPPGSTKTTNNSQSAISERTGRQDGVEPRPRTPIWFWPVLSIVAVSITGQALGAAAAAVVITVLVTVVVTIAAREVFIGRTHRVQLAQATAVAVSLVLLGGLWWQKDTLDLPAQPHQETPTATPTSRGVDLRGQHITPAMITGVTLRGAELQGAVMAGLNLRGQDLRGANAAGADLRKADLLGVPLNGANLSGADLREACLRLADLTGADLTGVDATGADVTNTVVTTAATDSAARWPERSSAAACP